MFPCGKNLFWPLRLLFFYLVVLLSAEQPFAQPPVFTPAPDDPSLLLTLAGRLQHNFQKEVSALPSTNRKQMTEMLKLQQAGIHKKFDHKEIYTGAAATGYLHQILQQIVSANPLLQQEPVSCYFSRSGIPNASYMGEGLILFNMGLFKELANESQAAFVLCHELAHYYLRHSENSIRTYVTTMNSDEVQHELRSIKRSQFNKRTELEKLMKNIVFDSRRHTRDHESQADSMAVEFLKNTSFDIGESLTALALLDTVDEDSLDTEACLQKTFNAPGYPFQKRWLAKRAGLLGGHAAADNNETVSSDSLKTHPDCKTRIKNIGSLVAAYRSPQQRMFPVSQLKFQELRQQCEYETIEYALASGNLTRSLFYTLALMEKLPADPYLVTNTGKIFNGLYTAQKAHILGKLTDLPSPGFPANYNTLLQFIQNLYLEDYVAIGYHYMLPFQPALQQHRPFQAAYATSIELNK